MASIPTAIRRVVVCMTILVLPIVAEAGNLCDDIHPPLPAGADDLRMHEEDFSFQQLQQSLRYLEKDLYRILKEHRQTSQVLESEHFYVSYPNSLNIIRGFLLRERVMREKALLELAELKHSVGQATEEDLEIARRAFATAKTEFCRLLAKVEYVD